MQKMNLFGNKRRALSEEFDSSYTAMSEMFSKMRPPSCWISCTLEELGVSSPTHEDFLIELEYEDAREDGKNKINAKTGKHFEWFKETSGNGNWVLYNTEMYEAVRLNGELTLHYKENCALAPFPPLNISSCKSMFEACTSLKSLDLSNFDFKVIERADYMFYNCTNLKSIITENSNDKINGYCMFYGCESLPGFNPDHIDGYMAKSIEEGGYFTLAKHD